MAWKLIILFYCGFAFSNDIVEEHLDGSRTVWKDDGSKVEVIKNTNVLNYHSKHTLNHINI